MNTILKIFAFISLAASSLIFIWFLFWAYGVAISYITPNKELNQIFDEATANIARQNNDISDEEVARAKILAEAKSIFSVITGLWGWMSLYIGAFFVNRPYREIPLLVKIGLLSGVFAVAIIPVGKLSLSIYPIVTAILLFTIWRMNAPNQSVNKDASR